MNRRTVVRLVAGAFAIVALVGCDDERVAISRDDLPDVATEATVSVTLGDDGFNPDQIEVTTSDLVAFVVVDGPHGLRTQDGGIDTGVLLADETTEISFDEPGRYRLVDVTDERHELVVDVVD